MSRPSTKVSAAPWPLNGPEHQGLAIARQQFAVSRQNCGVTTTACDDKAAHRTPKHHCMSNPMPGRSQTRRSGIFISGDAQVKQFTSAHRQSS